MGSLQNSSISENIEAQHICVYCCCQCWRWFSRLPVLPRRVLDSLLQVGTFFARVVVDVDDAGWPTRKLSKSLWEYTMWNKKTGTFAKVTIPTCFLLEIDRFFIDLGCLFVALARAACCKTSCTGIRPAGAAALLVRRFGMVFSRPAILGVFNINTCRSMMYALLDSHTNIFTFYIYNIW